MREGCGEFVRAPAQSTTCTKATSTRRWSAISNNLSGPAFSSKLSQGAISAGSCRVQSCRQLRGCAGPQRPGSTSRSRPNQTPSHLTLQNYFPALRQTRQHDRHRPNRRPSCRNLQTGRGQHPTNMPMIREVVRPDHKTGGQVHRVGRRRVLTLREAQPVLIGTTSVGTRYLSRRLPAHPAQYCSSTTSRG